MSQSSNHLRLVSGTWQWVHFTQMASTVTRSQSNRAPLGCGGTGDSHHGCAADKSAATAWRYHVNMDQNLGVPNKVASECIYCMCIYMYMCVYIFMTYIYVCVCVYFLIYSNINCYYININNFGLNHWIWPFEKENHSSQSLALTCYVWVKKTEGKRHYPTPYGQIKDILTLQHS